MLKFLNLLKSTFKEKQTIKSYNTDDDLEQFVSRRINSKLEVNKTQKHENELLKNLAGLRGITCLLYTSPSPRDRQKSRMPSSA